MQARGTAHLMLCIHRLMILIGMSSVHDHLEGCAFFVISHDLLSPALVVDTDPLSGDGSVSRDTEPLIECPTSSSHLSPARSELFVRGAF